MIMLLLALLLATADRFYVSNEGSGAVQVIEGSIEIARIPVGTRPRGLKLRGQTLYVAVSGSPRGGPGVDEKDLPPGDHTKDGIAVVDLAQRRVVARLAGGSDPESFDLDRDGKLLFVSNEDASARLRVLSVLPELVNVVLRHAILLHL